MDDKIVRSFGKSKTNLHGPPTQTGLDRFGIHGTLRGEAEHHSEGLALEGLFLQLPCGHGKIELKVDL